MQDHISRTPFSAEKLFSDPVNGSGSKSREFISPAEIKDFFWIHHRTILTAVAACTALAFLYVLFSSAVFTAKVQMLIDPKTPILREQSGEVNFSLDSAQVESHIAILRSEKIAAAVIKELNLADSSEFNSRSLFSIVRGWFGGGPQDVVKNRQAIAIFDQGLITRRLGRSYAIEVAFRSSNPEKAAIIANATAAAYIRDQIEAKADSAHQGSVWLEGRLTELRGQMNEATRRVQNFRARYDYAVSSPTVTADAAPKGNSQSQTPLDPGLQKTTLEELETTAETYRRIYESFLQAYTASVQRQSYPVSDVRIITPATAPLSKSSPSNSLILFLGALLGLTIGCGISLVQHLARRTA
jgi:uncharacterized protein involved in exopolysaccharide biosynthesis